MPMKIHSLSQNEYKFWRGTKDLFFQWSAKPCGEWYADKNAVLPNHGDLHLGNIGSYVTEEGGLTQGKVRLGLGMVDFDDSARLPFQIELIQGLVTLDLIARENKIELSAGQRAEIHGKVFDSYKLAVNSVRNATEMLKDDPTVLKMMKRATKKEYADELEKFTTGTGKFRRVAGKGGAITDVLDPVAPREWDQFASAISEAARNDDRLARLLTTTDATALRRLFKDVARRTRLGSSGSQGLHKYFILLDKPFAGVDHDVIIYFKQQIPTAAERSGVATSPANSPGQRLAQDMDAMTEPRAVFNSWCEVGGRSYWVYLKEPWSDEIEYDDIRDVDELKRLAHVWATVVGCSHREDGRFELILPRLTPQLQSAVETRADEYLEFQRDAFARFVADPRVRQQSGIAEAAIVAACQ